MFWRPSPAVAASTELLGESLLGDAAIGTKMHRQLSASDPPPSLTRAAIALPMTPIAPASASATRCSVQVDG
jgi:hypothetical protein